MRIYDGLPPEPLARPTFLTIGNFDGVHCGHQTLLAQLAAAAEAARAQSGVLTFSPHPLAVLRPDVPLSYLTTASERARLVGALGADFTLILPFSRAVAAMSAADFMADLVRHLNLRELWVGPDFALGRGREGNIERLAEIGRDLGYRVRVIDPVDQAGEPVRSSRIRALLGQDGNVVRAAEFLGRPYQLWGQVVRGAHRGQALGYPTANLAVTPDRVVPAFGIYACWAWIDDGSATEVAATSTQSPVRDTEEPEQAGPADTAATSVAGLPSNSGPNYQTRGVQAAVSIGTRPTFDNGRPTIEAYLLDFSGDLYGQPMGLSFVARLRPEMRFDGAAALIRQMEQDVQSTRRMMGDPPNDARLEATLRASSPAWRELRHTADWAIQVRGNDQRQLFARAASAMYSLQAGVSPAGAVQDAGPDQPVTLARAIDVSVDDAGDRDPIERVGDLLVAYLNRLLWAQEVYGEMYSRFQISEISERGLLAIAYGHRGAPEHTAVKAVTYHDLKVRQSPDGPWTARITFDV
jgi:riboflavin kinase/FMN adenylyltransferase